MKSQKTRNALFALLIPILILVYIFSGGSMGISLDFGEDSLTVSAEQYDWTVAYDKIESLELTVPGDTGTLLEGVQKRTLCCGRFENEQLGRYILCIDPRIENCIAVKMLDGTVFILNYENEESTRQLHKMFTDLLANKDFPA